jgi:hypothetical protein
MSAFVQATTPGLHSVVPASEDIRAAGLDPVSITREQYWRLTGHACERCAGTDGLRACGMAPTRSGPEGAGRLAWPVVACRHHAATGGAW